MVQKLSDWLSDHTCKGFTPTPHYSALGDCVTYYWKDEMCYAQRVDETLTMYFSMSTDEAVGCKVKGIRHILETADAFRVNVKDDDNKISLNVLFFAAALRTDQTKQPMYDRLRRLSELDDHKFDVAT